VQVQYSIVNDVQVRGKVENPLIRQALSYALYAEDQPSLRLRAVKAIGETYVSTSSVQDDEITEALAHALENDPNAGVRLKAAQVLKQLPLNNLVKNTLIRVLMRDENSAVRIQAIEALGQGNLTQDEQAVFHTAASDTNEYVRLQAKRLLGGQLEKAMQNSTKL
jgi:HEAT repeat protein